MYQSEWTGQHLRAKEMQDVSEAIVQKRRKQSRKGTGLSGRLREILSEGLSDYDRNSQVGSECGHNSDTHKEMDQPVSDYLGTIKGRYCSDAGCCLVGTVYRLLDASPRKPYQEEVESSRSLDRSC